MPSSASATHGRSRRRPPPSAPRGTRRRPSGIRLRAESRARAAQSCSATILGVAVQCEQSTAARSISGIASHGGADDATGHDRADRHHEPVRGRGLVGGAAISSTSASDGDVVHTGEDDDQPVVQVRDERPHAADLELGDDALRARRRASDRPPPQHRGRRRRASLEVGHGRGRIADRSSPPPCPARSSDRPRRSRRPRPRPAAARPSDQATSCGKSWS